MNLPFISEIIRKLRANSEKRLSDEVSKENAGAEALSAGNPPDEPDLRLIAVITAAIDMLRSSGTGSRAPYPGFRVKSIRRIDFFRNK